MRPIRTSSGVHDTVEDLIRLLDENPAWAEAPRSRLPTRELLELPAQFAEYAAAADVRCDRLEQTLAAFMEATVRRFEALDEQFKVVNVRLDGVDRRFEVLEKRFDLLEKTVEALNLHLSRRIDRFDDDMARLRARHAREMVQERSGLLARELGYRATAILSVDALWDLADQANTEDIAAQVMRSFRRADLIMEAVETASGEPYYLAVEISFTVNGRDTTGAIRNADLLTRFTGRRALPVVCGVRKDRRVDAEIASGNVVWYELEDADLETE